MSLNWTDTSKRASGQGIKIACHGLSGAGKTSLIRTAPRPIIASAEGGTLSIARDAIPLAEIRTLGELKEFYDFCKSPQASGFDTICIDSLTEIAERILAAEKEGCKDPRKAYGEMMDQVFAQVRLFRDLPDKNVYMTMKSGLLEMPDGTHMFFPIMPGKKTAEQIPFYFDELFFLGVGEFTPAAVIGKPLPQKQQYRFLQTRRTPIYEAKDRSGFLDEVEPPDLNHIFAKINKGLAG